MSFCLQNVYIQGCDHPECPAPWGLVRSSTRLFNANFDECYHYLKDGNELTNHCTSYYACILSAGGRGVSAYVIDRYTEYNVIV